MADGAGAGAGVGEAERELVYCHSCENEWYRDAGGLQCPQCQSEAVEIIEPDRDPTVLPGEADDILHPHTPWPAQQDAPDPEEADITTYRWSGPGVQFSSTTYRSPQQGLPRPGSEARPMPMHPMAEIFRSVFAAAAGRGDGRSPQPSGATSSGTHAYDGPPLLPQIPSFFPFPPEMQRQHPFGQQPSATTTTTVFGPHAGFILGTSRNAPASPAGPPGSEDLHGIFASLLGPLPPPTPGATGPPLDSPFSLLHSLFSPANARAGDAVYTQEALDRVISQLMEQHASDGAPGPASAAAIAALPRVPVVPAMLDDHGKADCSICMDDVSLGSEVVELPCRHWFHDACVAAWLREHDTCPQCRRGIMPKDGEGNGGPRQTGQTPRNMSWLWGGGGGSAPASPLVAQQQPTSESSRTSASTGWPALVETASARLGARRETRDDHAASGPFGTSSTAAQGTPNLPPRPGNADASTTRGSAHRDSLAEQRGHERRESQDGHNDGAGSAGNRAGLAGWLGRRFGG